MDTKLVILLVILMLSQAAIADQAEQVTRSVKINNNQIVMVLTPQPLSKFDIPGWYVEEELPAHTTFISTDADWHEISGNTLKMVRFMPSDSNKEIRYTLEVENREWTYTFDGIYKNELKVAGSLTLWTVIPRDYTNELTEQQQKQQPDNTTSVS